MEILNKFFKKNPINLNNYGFTVLELLVVISIIGILIAMGSVSYTTAQKKSRDSRRKSDLKAIQNAMEECYSVNEGTYETLGSGDLSGSISCSGNTVMSAIPTDPKSSSTTYYYQVTDSDDDSYTIYADLEDDGSWDGTEQDYSVSNLQ